MIYLLGIAVAVLLIVTFKYLDTKSRYDNLKGMNTSTLQTNHALWQMVKENERKGSKGKAEPTKPRNNKPVNTTGRVNKRAKR